MGQNTILAGALSTPTADTFTVQDDAGELLDSTTYYYRVSAINSQGETLAFAEVGQASGTGGGLDAHAITVKWLAVTGATGYRVYGRTTGAQELLAEVAAPTVEWQDDGSVDPDGALPAANTTGGAAATSSDVTLTAGTHAFVGIFSDEGIPGNQGCKVYMDTPGDDLHIGALTGHAPVMKLIGPGTWRVLRPERRSGEVVLGVFSQT